MRIRRYLMALSIGILVTAAVQDFSKAQTAANSKSKAVQYEVLNPWAEVDPIPLRGIAPRLDSLAGKKIGLFVNYKRASRPIGASVEKRLKSMYPDMRTSLFDSRAWNVVETETKNREKFIAWIKDVDAVILMVGD